MPNFYRQAYRAITEFEFYRIVYRQPVKQTLIFFVILAAHESVLSVVYRAFVDGRRLKAFAQWADQNSPRLDIRDGRLVVDADLPLVARHPEEPEVSLVFVEDEEKGLPAYEPPAFIFTPKGLRWPDENGTFFAWSFVPENMRRPLNLESIASALFWMVLFGIGVVTVLARILDTVIFSFFCFSAILRHRLKWPVMRFATLAVYALVPATIVKLLGLFLGLDGTIFGLTYLATAGIFCYQATVRTAEAEIEANLWPTDSA